MPNGVTMSSEVRPRLRPEIVSRKFQFWPNEKLRVRLESVQARDRGDATGQEQAPIRERGMKGAGQIKPEIRLHYIGTLVTMSQ